MRVKELMSILSKMDPEKDVLLQDDYILPIREIYERKPHFPGEYFDSFYVLEHSIYPAKAYAENYEWLIPVWTDPLAID